LVRTDLVLPDRRPLVVLVGILTCPPWARPLTRLHRSGLGLSDACEGLGPHTVVCLVTLLGRGPVGADRAGRALYDLVY
jgi:hypothetical protein